MTIRSSELLAAGPLDWSLLTGPVPVTIAVLGGLALAALCLSRRRNWWLRRGPLAVLVTVAATWLITLWVDDWWQPFPDGLPSTTVLWIGVALFGVFLALFRMPTLRWRGRLGALVAAVLVIVLSSAQINKEFQEYPTLRATPGPWQVKVGGLDPNDTAKEKVVAVPAGKTLDQVWNPPANLPTTGTVSTADIPGTVSRFNARDAYIYLPPAYRASPRPLLPVLVLMGGQPGSPEAWISSGGLAGIMDRFAAAHRGLAPVVAVVDPNGSTFGNTLCMDSKIAQAQTYLATDVPAWLHAHLQLAADRKSWTAGGLSFGGTCSLQLAVNAPTVYGNFLDLSGQDEPTLGSRSKTVSDAFGGDSAAFTRVNPLDVMKRTRFPDTAGAVVVGSGDSTYRPQGQKVFAACKEAGMDMTYLELPGGHSWQVWKPGLEQELPWLARQSRLTG